MIGGERAHVWKGCGLEYSRRRVGFGMLPCILARDGLGGVLSSPLVCVDIAWCWLGSVA